MSLACDKMLLPKIFVNYGYVGSANEGRLVGNSNLEYGLIGTGRSQPSTSAALEATAAKFHFCSLNDWNREVHPANVCNTATNLNVDT